MLNSGLARDLESHPVWQGGFLIL